MSEIFSTFPTIGCIAIICYIFAEAIKLTPLNNKWVPILVAILGGALGYVGQITGILELQNLTVLDAIATGICSGLVSCGVFSLFKNMSGAYDKKDGEE